MAYVHLTRDEAMLDRFALHLASPFAAPADLPPDVVRDLREKLFAVLTGAPAPVSEPLPVDLMQRMMGVGERGAPALVPRRNSFDAYNAQADDDLKSMVWSHPKARDYYRNSKGQVFLSCPYRLIDRWTMLREPKLEHYQLH